MAGYTRVDTSNNIADGNVISAADLDNEFDGIQAAFNASTGHNHDGTTGEGAPILVLGPTQDVVVGASTVTPKTTNTVDIGSGSLKFKDLYLAGNASIAGTLGVTGVATLTANPVMSGGTANGVAYLNGSKVLTTGSGLTFDGTNLGIGTSSPAAKLHIGGNTASTQQAIFTTGVSDSDFKVVARNGVSGSTAVQGYIGLDYANGTWPLLAGMQFIRNSTSGELAFTAGATTSASEQMRLTSTGLGIGTSSPAARLQVTGGATRLTSGGTGGLFGDDNASYLGLFASTTANAAAIYLNGQARSGFQSQAQYGASAHIFLNETLGSELMRILNTGNVGIGTSSPSQKLEVAGNMYINTSGNPYLQIKTSGAGNNPYIRMQADTNYWDIQSTFSNTNDDLLFQYNGTALLDLDKNGNLGLGVTPNTWYTTFKAFQFGGNGSSLFGRSENNMAAIGSNVYVNAAGSNTYINTNTASYFQQLNGAHYWFTAPSGTAGDAISFSQLMTLDASGNLLVGTTSGSTHVIQKSSASDIALNINNSSATSPRGVSFTFSAASPNDGTATFFTTADSTAYRGGWLSNGGVQNYQGNDSNLSDRREKTNFSPAKSYLETICAIPVQTFNYIDQNMEEDPGLTLGVVAQDVQEVAPELTMESNWGTEENPKMRLSIYQTDLQYALMKCIQEQQAIIESLKARLDAANL